MSVSTYLLITSDPDLSNPRMSFHHGETDRFARARAAHQDLGRNAFLAQVSERFVHKPEKGSDHLVSGSASISGYGSGKDRFFCLSCTPQQGDVRVMFHDSEAAAAEQASEMSRAHGRYAWSCTLDRVMLHPAPSKETRNIHIGIDYDEAPGTYRAVEARQGEEVFRFETGNPIRDWADMRSWLSGRSGAALTSSSVTHFLHDEPGYRMIEANGFEHLVLEDRPEYAPEILIRFARDNFDPHDFINGSCHDLALVLQEAAGGSGSLRFAMRREYDGESLFAETYSHMVFVDADGESWDIDGSSAIERWEGSFELGVEDKYGLVSEMAWEEIEPGDVPEFLGKWNGTSSPKLLYSLRSAMNEIRADLQDQGQPDAPKEEPLYAIMTDSPRPGSSQKLARVGPGASREEGFWTATDAGQVWLMDRSRAEEVRANLAYNNPRVVRAEKALKIIRSQAKPETDDVMEWNPFETEGPGM